jgi:hypothetical protein
MSPTVPPTSTTTTSLPGAMRFTAP